MTFQTIVLQKISKKTVIILLMVLSLFMTSATFAYWAQYVEGTEQLYSLTFHVGSPLYDDQEFILTSNVNNYTYKVPIEFLLDNPNENTDDIVYGIIWNDESLSEQAKEQLMNGKLTVTYNILITNNGTAVNHNIYNRYASLIGLEIYEENPNLIEYDSAPETHRFSVYLHDENRRNDYKNLAKYEVFIEIEFEVDVN